jgi:hypothetical protein
VTIDRDFDLTNEERLDLRRIDAMLARTKREIALAPQRQREAEAAAVRQRAIARAEEAALEWNSTALTPQARALQAHAVDLACEEPAITIEWLKPCARSRGLVGIDNALAVTRARTIVVPPITDVDTAVVVDHELAHVRTKRANHSTLESECAAWRWAREHALIWNEEAQRRMYQSLQTYIKAAERDDILAVLEAERLCSRFEFLQERQRRLEMSIEAERKAQHGARR